MTPAFSRTYSVPVHPFLDYRRVVVEISVPALPTVGAPIRFAEHVQRDGRPTDTVIACSRGGVVVSEDLGATWEWVPIPALSDVVFRNSFTTADGLHLLQGEEQAPLDEPHDSAEGNVPVALLDPSWQLVARPDPALSRWHGSRSIDEADGVIVYGEYPANTACHRPGFDRDNPKPEQLEQLRDSRLMRSVDGGRSWEAVLQLDWQTIRHFHTVVADPWHPGRWWASVGDRPIDCRVWESIDHGLSWSPISVELPVDELHPAWGPYAQSVLRYTDIAVRESDLIWGTDDLLGGGHLWDPEINVGRRAGARLFRSPKDQPWRPSSIHHIGARVRSLVDVGPGYMVITQAKGPFGYCPQVLLLWKPEPFHLTPLITIDNFRIDPAATGFTYSRASRSAKDGVFFSYRSAKDAFPGGAELLRWRVLFD
jgi:hypothetical protein